MRVPGTGFSTVRGSSERVMAIKQDLQGYVLRRQAELAGTTASYSP